MQWFRSHLQVADGSRHFVADWQDFLSGAGDFWSGKSLTGDVFVSSL